MNNPRQFLPDNEAIKLAGGRPIDDAVSIWNAGVAAVAAETLVHDNVSFDLRNGSRLLSIGDYEWELDTLRSILIVGAGKAGAAMAAGLERALDRMGEDLSDHAFAKELKFYGVINVPAGTERSLRHLKLLPARPAGLNEPTEAGVQGSAEILNLVRRSSSDEGCIVLLSGGGSALMPLPVVGITLNDKVAVTRHLSDAGANIEQLNVVRKHLSAIKGGKLASACGARWLHTLVISDVLGDPLDLIASGPTVVDTSTSADALRILQLFDPQQHLPKSVYKVLSDSPVSINPAIDEDRLAERVDEISVIGNNAVAVDAAGVVAERLGYNHAMTSARHCEGSAEEVGWHLAEMAVSMVTSHLDGLSVQPNCLISGGEPVVTLVSPEIRGLGGRNQQLVLAAFDRLKREPPEIQQMVRRHVAILSAGTDGEDGPTDAAGAFIDDAVWRRAEELNLVPQEYLATNNAYRFFELTGGLFKTGPTGTNVCDLRVVVVKDHGDT